MYHKIRITVVSLAVITICMLSSTTTLSYFTDSDVRENDFAIGRASTSLEIYGDVSGEKQVFDVRSLPPLEDDIDISFHPQATNDGNIPVYQRFRIVIPITLASVVTLNLPTMDNNCTIETTSENTCSNNDYTVTYKPSVDVAGTPTYAEYYIVSNQPLAVNNTTSEWPMEGIHFGDVSSLDESLLTCDAENIDCVFGVNAYSDVIQTTGFTDAIDAFANLEEAY